MPVTASRGRPRKALPASTLSDIEVLEATEHRAREDFAWACNTLFWIKPEDAPLQLLTLNYPQRYLLRKYLQPSWDRNEPLALVIHKARRHGVSTLTEAWFYHKVRFYPGQSVLVAAHLDRTVNELHGMVQRFHDQLPPEMQPPTRHLNRKELAYLPPLDSRMSVVAARYMDISRGMLINHAHLSEVAFMPDPETIMGGLDDAVPSRGRSSIILESTANGINTWWHDLWNQLGKKNRQYIGGRRWQRVFLPWFAHPDYWLPVPHAFQFTAEERDMQKRFKLRDEQLVWYRMKLQQKELQHPGHGKKMMHQEHPSTAEEGFIASGEGIFPDDVMDRLVNEQRHPRIGFEFVRTGTWQFQLRPRPLDQAEFLVWEEPKPSYQYTIGVDVGEGHGGDDSAIVVVRMPGFVQVAIWENNETSTADLAGLVAAVARYYSQTGGSREIPIVNVEVTGPGLDTNSRLSDFYSHEPFQLYIWETLDRLSTAPVTAASKTGWVTSHISKQIMVSTANSLLIAGLCQIPSSQLQADMRSTQEHHLSRMISYGTGGCDLTVAWLLAIVAAWRKIARWAWPGSEMLPLDKPEHEKKEWRDPAYYDTTADELFKPAPVGMSTQGDNDVPWLLQ
jgi:hypothetical protein